MAYLYRIYKQFIPARFNDSDPNWSKRQIWVAKLNAQDSIDEFETIEDARTKRDELDAADPTERIYKITQIDLDRNEPNTDVE
jgi:hypothetical protein